MRQLLLIAALTLMAASCHKKDGGGAGKGGSASLQVYPQHHKIARNLVNMIVYVKYNTSDAPANGVYDDSLSCVDADTAQYCIFPGLKNGNYYFYGKGYDTSIKQAVQGGLPYTITLQQAQVFDLPVSEN